MASVQIIEEVVEKTPEAFREALSDRIVTSLAKIANAKGMKDLILPIESEQISETTFEYYLRDMDGRECTVSLELRPIIVN
jgi:hypothetical protein